MESNESESDFRLLPKFLQAKKAIMNPKNTDRRSFGYAIALYFHPSDWRDNPNHLPKEERFYQHNLDALKYPVTVEDIPQLEDKLNIRINVFSFIDPTGHKRCHLYISKKYKKDEVNLIYWEGRFAWIKFLSRLFYDAIKYVILVFYYNNEYIFLVRIL